MIKDRHRRWYLRNVEKQRQYSKAWALKNPIKRKEIVRRYRKKVGNLPWIARRYGLTVLELQALYIKHPVCDICGNNFGNRGPCIDHIHGTKIIRGILCNGCNCGLGNFKDQTSSLRGAISYLEASLHIVSGANNPVEVLNQMDGRNDRIVPLAIEL